MSKIKVSIITVCYNSEKTIEQTICSVLGQTYKNIEYIVVDGGSKDKTLDIVGKYGDKIKVISEADDGIYHAMNKGIMKASGDIIGIINSDDWYEHNAVELAVEYLNYDNCDLVYGGCKCIFDNGLIQDLKCRDISELPYRMVFAHQTVFMKRKVYEKFGIFNQRYKIAADYDMLLRFYECGVKMVEIPANIAFFRMSGLSNTHYEDTIKETEQISFAHWDGKTEEVRFKIEKYSEERFAYARLQEAMNRTRQDLGRIVEEMFQEKNDYIIFGAGNYGAKCLQFLRDNGIFIDCFVDNNTTKWGERCGDVEIKNPFFIKHNRKNVIVANVYYKEEIRKQLEEMGYQFGVDCVFVEDILQRIVSFC